MFATAFLVGLIERTCVEALVDHLDWPAQQTVDTAIHVSHRPAQQTVGTAIQVSHTAPTPPGLTVTVDWN